MNYAHIYTHFMYFSPIFKWQMNGKRMFYDTTNEKDEKKKEKPEFTHSTTNIHLKPEWKI